jgi:hypothetical protein
MRRKNYSRALESYTNAAAYAENYGHLKEFEAARLGIGRNSLRCGQIQRGMEIIAQPHVSATVKVECAEILENTKVRFGTIMFNFKNCILIDSFLFSFYERLPNCTKMEQKWRRQRHCSFEPKIGTAWISYSHKSHQKRSSFSMPR